MFSFRWICCRQALTTRWVFINKCQFYSEVIFDYNVQSMLCENVMELNEGNLSGLMCFFFECLVNPIEIRQILVTAIVGYLAGLLVEASVKLSFLEVCGFLKVCVDSHGGFLRNGNQYVSLDSSDLCIFIFVFTYWMESSWLASERWRIGAGLTCLLKFA